MPSHGISFGPDLEKTHAGVAQLVRAPDCGLIGAYTVPCAGLHEENVLSPMKHLPAVFISFAVVAVFRITTPISRIMTDGSEYLKVAVAGLDPAAHLGAPFVYRFAVPMFVHGLYRVSGTTPEVIFPVVVFIASGMLLLATYFLALSAGVSKGKALLIMGFIASSVFAVRFPLYCPFDVDIEAVLLSFIVFALLVRRSYAGSLAVSLVGLLFKEFFLAPLAVLAWNFLTQYVRQRTLGPLRWLTLTVVMTVVVFFAPRLMIPVSTAYGAIIQVRSPEPSQTMYLSELRTFLAWPPQIGTPVNLLLAILSFWLPVLMLMTRDRCRVLWNRLGENRTIVLCWMLTVSVLMSVGGTKLPVFATYTAPLFVLIVGMLAREGVSVQEMLIVLVATALFNRTLIVFGTPGGDPGELIYFYGAYWHELSEVTLVRYAEMAGWVGLAWAGRWTVSRSKTRNAVQ